MVEVDGGSAPGPEVVLMCGVAGSGKTTHARRWEARGYTRLSVDEEVWARFGRHGIDYRPDRYAELSDLAEGVLRERLRTLVTQGHDVVVDLSLWRRHEREDYKQLIEHAGGHWRLVYLNASPQLLRRRLADRSHRFDANAAFPVDEAMLTRYLTGFEAPSGEGEEMIVVPG
ncbi:MAG: AAA family ATPase [Janthinobacterium lividum]